MMSIAKYKGVSLARRRRRIGRFSGWRYDQDSRRVAVLAAKLGRVTTMAFMMLVLTVVIWSWWGLSNKQWNGKNRVSVLIDFSESEDLAIVSLDPVSEELTYVLLDEQLKIPLIGGYGLYKTGVVDDLAVLENRGERLFEDSVAHWLGIDVLGTMSGVDLEVWDNIHLLRKELVFDLKSTVGFWDRFSIAWKSLDVASVKVNRVDLVKDGLATKQILPDGTVEYVVDDLVATDEVAAILRDPHITNVSELSITIVNASESPGLARVASETLNRAGYEVIRVTTARSASVESVLFVDSKFEGQENLILHLVSDLFGVEPVFREGIEEEYRAGAALVIGREYDEFVNRN